MNENLHLNENRHRWIPHPHWLALLLLAIFFVGLVDIVLDIKEGAGAFHLLAEFVFITLCLAAAAWLGSHWLLAERGLKGARRKTAQAEYYMQGLSGAIEQQLRDWDLTEVERETALLLLKGLSHKDIAAATGRGERTVRQHAVSVYRKSGLAGRAELSAFFLEDLLPAVDVAQR